MGSVSTSKDSACGPKSRPNRGKRVRIVGNIRPLLEKEIGGSSSIPPHPWVSVLKPEGESPDYATIIFQDQEDAISCKESYKLDWCYEEDDDVGEIFLREVKPLLQGIFHGSYATVLAYGAQGCGKTQLIEGSEEKPGLVPLTIAEILSPKEKSTCSVTMSCYEVYQDRVFDLMGHKEKEIHVLEDANGRIHFKGLSKVPVKSMSNFRKLYFHGCKKRKPSANDATCRSHKGLIIYVSHVDKESNLSIIGRMNFIDLAGIQGYEDVKQKNKVGPHITKSASINKSLYALQNVIYALNANEAHVPYRESKLTHLLRDSLSRESQAVMITCLKPTPCQDTIQAVSMASRACQAVNKSQYDSVKRSKSGPRPVPFQSPASSGRPLTLSSSMKKPGISRFGSIEKKISGTPSVRKGRNLFALKSHSVISLQGKLLPEVTMGTAPFTPKKETCVLEIPKSLEPSPEKLDVCDRDEQSYFTSSDVEFGANISTVPKDSSIEKENQESIAGDCASSPPVSERPGEIANSLKLLDSSIEKENQESIAGDCASSPPISERPGEIANSLKLLDSSIEKENHESIAGGCAPSPPISERLRKIANSLKLLSTQPLSIIPPREDIYGAGHALRDPMEPKTPEGPFSLRVNDKWDIGKTGTPQERFKTRSAGLKNNLVQECLTLLNSANKEELKELKGIGEKRAAYILKLRQGTSNPFKELDDVKRLGLSSKQVTEMMTKALGEF